jgi:large subunit ribosomal protein L6
MSRIGRQPITIPSGVQVEVKPDRQIVVKGPEGQLTLQIRPEITVAVDGGTLKVTAETADSDRFVRAWHGMTRALVQNMVLGVTKGYEKKLEIQGVGWNAQAQPKKVVLNIGYCHQVEVPIPDGIKVECPNPTTIAISGPSKQGVGQLAANIRAIRPPEPYKGKGIRYDGEYVRRKAGKSFGS